MSDEKALDDSLADYTDKLLAQASDNPIPAELEEEARIAASLQRLIAPKGQPSAQMRQQLSLRLATAFDANEREKLRRKRLPFFRRYPIATASAAVLLLVFGIVAYANPELFRAENEVGTSVGALDLVTLSFFVVLGILGLAAAFFLERRK